MPLIRHLLRNDVLAAIKSNISRGIWTDSLPSERQLTEQYQVSRGTLRYALKILQEEGIIQAHAGAGYAILKNQVVEQAEPSSISIGILIGSQQGRHEARSLTWIPALQQRIAKRGWNIHMHEGIAEIGRSPTSALKKLFKSTNHSCWLLVRCPQKVQQYFSEKNVPAIICGSPFDGIELPSIDLDYRAIGRHAAGYLAGKRHQRIGYVRSADPFPGDTESLKGFKEGSAASSLKPSVKIIRFSHSKRDYQETLKQVKNANNPITALFVDDPFQFLSIFNQAILADIKIPEDLSIVCRQECDFLDYLSPIPARYQSNPRERANKIHREIEARIQGDPLKNHRTLLLPEFVKGLSVTNAPSTQK